MLVAAEGLTAEEPSGNCRLAACTRFPLTGATASSGTHRSEAGIDVGAASMSALVRRAEVVVRLARRVEKEWERTELSACLCMHGSAGRQLHQRSTSRRRVQIGRAHV